MGRTRATMVRAVLMQDGALCQTSKSIPTTTNGLVENRNHIDIPRFIREMATFTPIFNNFIYFVTKSSTLKISTILSSEIGTDSVPISVEKFP